MLKSTFMYLLYTYVYKYTSTYVLVIYLYTMLFALPGSPKENMNFVVFSFNK